MNHQAIERGNYEWNHGDAEQHWKDGYEQRTYTPLQSLCESFGWRGGTIHEARARYMSLTPLLRAVVIARMEHDRVSRRDIDRFLADCQIFTDLDPVRTEVVKI